MDKRQGGEGSKTQMCEMLETPQRKNIPRGQTVQKSVTCAKTNVRMSDVWTPLALHVKHIKRKIT